MKRALAAFIITALILSLSPCVLASEAADDFDGYIVRMASPLKEDEAEKSGCEALGGALYYAPDRESVAAIRAFGEVLSCEKNFSLQTQDDLGDYEPAEWNLRSVGASAAWTHVNGEGERDRTGSGVTIAIVDSGVMADHPDLVNANVLDYICLSGEPDGIDNYHGTFVAGLIAAEVNNAIGIDGIVPDVNILPICITSNGGKTDMKTAAQGINTAVENGADVIVFSIGGTNDNSLLSEACEAAVESGVIFVTCAGNYSSGRVKSEHSYMYPAAYDCTVTVSAVKEENGEPVFDGEYSYFNDAVTVAAPGTDIVSLFLDGGTATKTGTSFAAPVVAAMAAMAKCADKDITTEAFVELLKESSTDLGEPGFDVYYGNGYVNIPAFLDALDEYTASAVPDDPVDPEPPDDPIDPEPPDDPIDPEPPDDPVDPEPPDDPVDPGLPDDPVDPGLPDDPVNPEPTDDPADPEPSEEPEPKPETSPYPDVSVDSWSYPGIKYVTEKGIMTGIKGLFEPDTQTSRAMIVTMLWRMEGMPAAEYLLTFTDVDEGSWYTEAVRWAASEGIVTGYNAETFGPNDKITREQLAAMLYRYAAHCGIDVEKGRDFDLSSFADTVEIAEWAEPYFRWAVSAGLINGVGEMRLVSKGMATRAQTAAVIMRFCALKLPGAEAE